MRLYKVRLPAAFMPINVIPKEFYDDKPSQTLRVGTFDPEDLSFIALKLELKELKPHGPYGREIRSS